MSKTGAAYFLKLSGVGKTTHRKGTAAAHYRYVSRLSAIGDCGGYLFPEDWVEAQVFLHSREKTIRANGKVLDKIVVNLPYSLAPEQRTELVKDFCEEISGGRAPYAYFVHVDTDAPHAHIIYVDADHDTGKRVFKMSDSGALFKLRKVWESAVNKHLVEAGLSYRVSRWGKYSTHHKELNMHPANENVVPFPIPEPPIVTVTALDQALAADSELSMLQRAKERVLELEGQQKDHTQRLNQNKMAQKVLTASINDNMTALAQASERLERMGGWKNAVKRWFSHSARTSYRAANAVKHSANYNLSADTNQLIGIQKEAVRLRDEEAQLVGAVRESKRITEAYGTMEEMNAHNERLYASYKEAVSHMSIEEVQYAYNRGHITPAQYARITKAMGRSSGYGY